MQECICPKNLILDFTALSPPKERIPTTSSTTEDEGRAHRELFSLVLC